ncbi:MAG TPA: VOC family protein, partial [Acidimicrobiia bacterium]|nr:VOC family protein [Acidimicrobiia bacterium]
KLLGWETEPVPDTDYTLFKLDGHDIGGAMKPAMPGMPPHWLVYFEVADTDAVVAKAQAAGATVLSPPMDIPAGRFAVLADPQGAVFGVIKSAQQ